MRAFSQAKTARERERELQEEHTRLLTALDRGRVQVGAGRRRSLLLWESGRVCRKSGCGGCAWSCTGCVGDRDVHAGDIGLARETLDKGYVRGPGDQGSRVAVQLWGKAREACGTT